MGHLMTRRERARRLLALLLSPIACWVLCLAGPAPARAQITCVVDVISCGGGTSESVYYVLYDTVGQGLLGPTGEGVSTSIRDGFWLVLPGAGVPVEGAFFATLTESETVVLRWTVGSLADIVGFNVYRSISSDGPLARVNQNVLPPKTPGSYEDSAVWPETTFWYQVRAVLADGSEDAVAGGLAAVTTGGHMLLGLYPPRPNPFTVATTLRLDIPDHAGPVGFAVYSARGQLVRSVHAGPLGRGRHELTWDGCSDEGAPVPSGVYFIRLDIEGRSQTQKALVLR